MEEQSSETEITTTSLNAFADPMGRLLELGFNSGLLTAISQAANIKAHFGDVYKQDLQSLSFQPIYARMCERIGVLSTWDKEALERWVLFLLQKGFLAGMNFFKEYLSTFADEKKEFPREIVYIQCNFYGDNSLGTYAKNERTAAQELLNQFRAQQKPFEWTEEDFKEYRQKGNFLRADVLLLLRYGKQWRILSIDLSVFALRSLQDAGDLTSIEKIRQILGTELHYAQTKSAFTNLSIDTDAEITAPELFSEKLRHYFAAFKRRDKESVKLIQAASYAANFYDFLLKKNVLTPQNNVIFNVVGYTDRAISTISLTAQQLPILQTCADIYKNLPYHTIDEERSHVLNTIKRATASSFDNGKTFVNELVHLVDEQDGVQWLRHEERLDTFVNTRVPLTPEQLSPEVRESLKPEAYVGHHIQHIHEQLVTHALEAQQPYLFLTGHPGIGKTTAVVKFLKSRSMQGEGFLFLYISPRKQVNLDIIKKFRDDEFGLHCDDLLALTTNSIAIRSNGRQPTVHYYSKKRQDRFKERDVDFIFMESEEAKLQRTQQRRLEEIQEGLLIDRGEQVSGVLGTLCRALYTSVDKPLSRAIVGTVAIQSLKRTHQGTKTTLHHFEQLFQLMQRKGGRGNQRIQHLFIMIDEVTGDESGVEFVGGIHALLKEYHLLQPENGLNTKIIVADASIIDPAIIQQHLSETTYEPDKIFFRRAYSGQHPPLSQQQLMFRQTPAIAINANAYPASALRIIYNVGVDALLYNEETYTERSKQLHDELQQRIVTDILTFLEQPSEHQLLVYIQDKYRLSQLIAAIKKQRSQFELYEEFLEVHANIAEEEKLKIQRYQNDVRVVFMTASASRGLSFKKATHIIVDIPRFAVEQNLMEILQVIYRGRGGELDQEEKTLKVYLTDRVLYNADSNRSLAVQEGMLALLNILLIFKTSMMTRIVGSGPIGLNQHFLMIPIGGKSVTAVGDTLTSRLGRLIKELQDQSHRTWNDPRLDFVATQLIRILSKGRIILLPYEQGSQKALSYIPQISTFSSMFQEAVRKNFAQLLTFPVMEQAYFTGGLLVVPIQNHEVQETYWVDVKKLLAESGKQRELFADMEQLSFDRRYPDSMRMAMKDALHFLKQLEKAADDRIPYYEQESNHQDQHYAIPLLAFLAHRELQDYFAQYPDGEETLDNTFRSLLGRYIRAFYPVDSLLPISHNYKAFPFIVFRSFNLQEARHKMFTGKYLFMSHELNIINMLLSSNT